jgi:YjbE family integral membrane protein
MTAPIFPGNLTDLCIPLLQIIGINVVLSGDNAVVVALAARSLPPNQQRLAIIWGSVLAALARILLTLGAALVLKIPGIRLIGSLLLLWIGVKLLLPENEERNIRKGNDLAGAIRVILIADLALSLDNVLAVAAAAHGNMLLLSLSLLLSIPIILFGGMLTMRLMGKFPILITLGAALLGWVSGEMMAEDSLLSGAAGGHGATLGRIAPAVCALLVIAVGKFLPRWSRRNP